LIFWTNAEVFSSHLVWEFSVDRVLEWTIMRCSFFKVKILRSMLSGVDLML